MAVAAKTFTPPSSVYDYSLTLDQTRTVNSLTLPNNANVVILAVALANEPVTVPLASYYNRAGIYTDANNLHQSADRRH